MVFQTFVLLMTTAFILSGCRAQETFTRPLSGSELGRWANLPIMDTHVHLSNWDILSYTYSNQTLNYHNYTHEEYKLASAFSNAFPMTNHPECCYFMMGLVGIPHEEQLLQSIWSQEIANKIYDETPHMCGIVTTISYEKDLAGDIEEFRIFLDKIEKQVPLNVGYRCSFTNLSAPEGIQGLEELAKRGATMDVFTGTLQEDGSWTTSIAKLQQVDVVAKKIPELVMIVDHNGLPGVPGTVPPNFEQWKAFIEPLVKHSNVYIKVSSGALGIDITRPYFDFLVAAFGYSRLIWSSNWYNINGQEGFYSYNSWAATVAQYMIHLNATDEDAAQILFKTAQKAYNPPTSHSHAVFD